jgi:hypothetical protein
MKLSKYTILFGAVCAVILAFSLNAKANIITPLPGNPYDVPNQKEATIIAAANAAGVDADEGTNGDITIDVRLNTAGSVTNSFGTFTVTDVSTGVETFSFSLNPGFVLAGLMLHDGNDGMINFYSINDETSGTNEGPVSTPINASGGPGGLSNFDFLIETNGAHTPDSGATAILLGLGLAGLSGLRAKFRRN